jgi:hypothetical protein
MVFSGSIADISGILRVRLVVLVTVAVCLLASAMGNRASAQALFTDDSRLDAPVTYSSDGGTVGQVVADLAATTKVPMIAGMNKDDWLCYDRRVVVYVTKMPLRDLMSELATVLRFTWTRNGEQDKWSYRLSQTKAQWDEEESLRNTARDARERELKQKREAVLAQLRSAVGSADKASLKSSNPWAYVLATQPLGRAVVDFLDGYPAAGQAYVNGAEMSVPVSALSPALQGSAKRIAESYCAMMRGLGGPDEMAQSLKYFDQFQVTVNRRMPVDMAYEVRRVDSSMLGKISVGNLDGWIDIPIFDPSTDVGRAYANAVLSLKPGINKNKAQQKLLADTHAAVEALEAKELQANADVKASDLPGPFALFPLAVPAPRQPGAPPPQPPLLFARSPLPATLGALANITKYDIVSDFFVDSLPNYPRGKKSSLEHLTLISVLYNKSIVKDGNLIRMTDREWFTRRGWDVPTVWLAFWAKTGEDYAGLLLPELIQIAALRDEQIDHAIFFDPTMASFGAGEAATNREILRFLKKLSEAQLKTLQSGPIAVKDLTDEQLTALRKALAAVGGLSAFANDDKAMVKLSVNSEGETIDYRVRYFPSPEKKPVEFRIEGGFEVLPSLEDKATRSQ